MKDSVQCMDDVYSGFWVNNAYTYQSLDTNIAGCAAI